MATQEKLIQNVAKQLQEELQNKRTRDGSSSESEEDDKNLIENIASCQTAKVRSNSLPEIRDNKDRNKSSDKYEFMPEKVNKVKAKNESLSGKGNMYGKKSTNIGAINHYLGNNQNLGNRQRGNDLYDNLKSQGDGTNQGRRMSRPYALTQGRNQQNAANGKSRNFSQRNLSHDNKKKDEVFFNNRKSVNNRRDSSGFQYTRDQRKRMQYKNKITESNLMRLFVYNVPNKYNVDNLYDHFTDLGVHVKDLWGKDHIKTLGRNLLLLKFQKMN